MTIMTKAERKVANLAAHRAHNDAIQHAASLRRKDRQFEGLSRMWLHNARLKFDRLEAERVAKGFKPYEMTYAQASAFEGTSEEAGGLLFYRVPMPLDTFRLALPKGSKIVDDGGILSLMASSMEVGCIEDEEDESFVISIDHVIVDCGNDEDTVLYQGRLRAAHELVIGLGGEITEWDDGEDDEDLAA